MVANHDQELRAYRLWRRIAEDMEKDTRDPKEVADVLQVIHDHRDFKARLRGGVYTIDCDPNPYTPESWTMKCEDQLSGMVRGRVVWDPTKVKLHLSPNQRGGKCIDGNKLRNELENKPVLNANVLDFLLKNSHLIPEEWKKDANGNNHYIYFWGTIYRGSDGRLCVLPVLQRPRVGLLLLAACQLTGRRRSSGSAHKLEFWTFFFFPLTPSLCQSDGLFNL